MKKILSWGLILALSAAGTAFADATSRSLEKSEMTDDPDVAPIAEPLTDEQLREEVKQALLSEPSTTDAQKITVTAVNGRVTLRGMLETEEDKQFVLSKAEKVAGVGNVIDKLGVRRK